MSKMQQNVKPTHLAIVGVVLVVIVVAVVFMIRGRGAQSVEEQQRDDAAAVMNPEMMPDMMQGMTPAPGQSGQSR